VLYFASARTCVEIDQEVIELPSGQSVVPLSHLTKIILGRHAAVASELAQILERSAWSVNEEIVSAPGDDGDVAIKPGDVVAVIPPVSGG
jgi:molybdopterin converting factor small subunit